MQPSFPLLFGHLLWMDPPSLGAFAAVLPLISAADESEKKGAAVAAAPGDINVRVERLLHLVPLYATAFIGKITFGVVGFDLQGDPSASGKG